MLLSYDINVFKHGISRERIEEVFADKKTEEFEMESSKSGNYRVMYVGYAYSDQLLEIGVECFESVNQVFLHVFHANRAGLYYRRLYKEAKRR